MLSKEHALIAADVAEKYTGKNDESFFSDDERGHFESYCNAAKRLIDFTEDALEYG